MAADSGQIVLAFSDRSHDVRPRSETMAGMKEEQFRLFYEVTASRLRAYIRRTCGDPAAADDLLQEAFLRLLRTELPEMDETGLRKYLYRIATNLIRDRFRRWSRRSRQLTETAVASEADRGLHLRTDMERILLRLRPLDRELLWLAYVEGATHEEIAEVAGLKAASVRPMLYRARRRLARLLRSTGLAPTVEQGGGG